MNKDFEHDARINELCHEKHELIRDYDHGKMRSDKYSRLYDKITAELETLLQEKLDYYKTQLPKSERAATTQKRALTRQLNKLKKENRARAGRRVDPNSFSTIILDALADPKLNTIDKVMKHVAKIKTVKVDNNLRNKVNVIISYIKNNKGGKYKGYVWNKETCTATKK